MNDKLNLDILTKTFDDLPVGVGIFHVEDLEDLKSVRYVYMNKIVLYEMRKEREEVFGKRIIEVAPEAYEHEVGLQVIEMYRNVAVNKKSIDVGVVEYSNDKVAGKYECSAHHIKDNYVYVMLRNVTELEETKNELAEINKNLEKIVWDRTIELENSKKKLVDLNEELELRVKERTALLERKNKEQEQFVYVASHDLQEPLRTISSFIGLLEEQYNGRFDEAADKYLEIISTASTRMTNLIKALLDHSRLGEEKDLTKVDCNKLVKDIQDDLSIKIKNSRTSFEVSELPTIIGAKTELRLLFQNLISNAIKFSNPEVPPKIKISAEKGENWTIAIRDNGIGISEKYQRRIFDIFQRLHTSKEYEGTGIGLAHCKKIIESHQGDIWVESTIGKGSTFYFTLPLN